MDKYRKPPDDLVGRLAALEERLVKLERNPRIGNTAIDKGNLVVKNGNSVFINDDGAFEVNSKDGNNIVNIRRLPDVFGVGRGANYVQFFRPDGTTILEVFSADSDGDNTGSSFQFFDNQPGNSGFPIISDNTFAGGLRDPWLAVPWAPENVAQISSASATLVPIARATFRMYHYVTQITLDISCPAGTVGRITVAMDSGSTYVVSQQNFDSTTPSPTSIGAFTQGAFSNGLTAGDPGFVAPIAQNFVGVDVQNYVSLVVSVSRVSGAGTVSARVRSWNNGGA